MKRVVLVEGENDFILCKCLLRKSGILDSHVKIFFNKGEKKAKRNQETTVLKSLSHKNFPYEMVIKVEKGRGPVLSLFRNIAINFLVTQSNTYFTVIFDHDRRNPDDDIMQLIRDIESRSKHISLSKPVVTNITDDVKRRDITIQKHVGEKIVNIGGFSITSFKISLEQTIITNQKGLSIEEQISRFARKLSFDDFFGGY